jgi:transcriptional regulator with XRE-family HTH domain
MSYFSKNLKFLREQRKLSQNKLAELSDVNQTTIARWESEEISPSLDNIYDVANVLNVSIADLTGRDLTNEQPVFDELELLFSKNKDILTDDDKETIKFVIEKAKRKVDEQLDKK